MSRLRKPICGVSMKPYYLEKETWSVALLTVCRNKYGDLCWQTLKGIMRYKSFLGATVCVDSLAVNFGVEIYLDCKRGDLVTKEEEKRLREKGLLDHLK